MCALLLAVVLLYGFNNGRFDFLQNKTQKQVAVQSEEEKIKRTDYTEVARKTLDWIDKQRNEDGWYILERGCDYEKKTCDIVWDNKEGNKDGLIATWARLNFYEQHKDPKDLEIVKKDIDIFYEKYKDDNLKDSLWICKITYEMAQSKYLEQGQKDKLKELCMNYKTMSIEEVVNYWMGEDIKIVDKNLTGKNRLIDDWGSYVELVSSYDPSLTGLTNLVYRYLWLGGKDDKDLAEEYLKLFDEVYGKNFEIEKNEGFFNHKRRYPDDVCLMVYSSLDWFRLVAKDNKSIEVLANKYGKYTDKSIDNNDILTPICGLVDKKFLEILMDKIFLSNLESNNNFLIANFKNNYDDGFFILSRKNREVSIKNIVENALMVDLLKN